MNFNQIEQANLTETELKALMAYLKRQEHNKNWRMRNPDKVKQFQKNYRDNQKIALAAARQKLAQITEG